MEQLPAMEILIRKIEAIRAGESKETIEQLKVEKGEWMVREAESFLE